MMDMGRYRKSRPMSEDDRILPLINIVFLLLIFFMLAGRLSASDPFDVAPPESISTSDSGDEKMLVLVGPEGQLAVNGVSATAAEMFRIVREASEAERALIRLKADNAAPAAKLVAVMRQLREAGVQKVRLLTVRTDQK